MNILFVQPLPVASHLHGKSFSATSPRNVRITRRRPRSFSPVTAQRSDGPNGPQGQGQDDVMNWQEELNLLLDPKLSVSAKQVLIQDFAKRLPDVLKSPCARGFEDLFRQLTEDAIPDLVMNGPRYFSRAVESASSRVTPSSPSSKPSSFKPPSIGVDDVSREIRNVFNRTPEGLFTPEFDLLHTAASDVYSIRRYPTVIVAESAMRPDSGSGSGSVSGETVQKSATEVESAAAMGSAFNTLAGYLFGKNQTSTEMKMTTPVMLNKGLQTNESMSFIIGEYARVEDVPKTMDDSVTLREEPGAVYAVVEFSGFVTVGEAKRQREKLTKALQEDGIKITTRGKEAYKCMIYNGPSTLPNLRRNELMIEVEYGNDEEVSEQE